MIVDVLIPAIGICEQDRNLYTLDDRRLESFCRANVEIPYRWAKEEERADEVWKFHAIIDGKSIRVRGQH